MKRLSLLLGSLSLVGIACATTYVRVEKDGTKTYSDRPLPGGQPVQVDPIQTYEAPANSSLGTAQGASVPEEQRSLQDIDDFNYTSCGVTPKNDETFTNPESVPITVELAPGLRPGDVMTLSVDGKVVGTNLPSFLLQPAFRGTHTVQVTVKSPGGRVVCNSTTSFHVMRPSLNMPGRR